MKQLEAESYILSNKTNDDDERNHLLQQNLNRFEEERRQFEREKLKFLEEKRELDRLRLQRFERYKRELEARRLGLQPNYEIDNPNDYKVARKIVLDNMNERLSQQRRVQQQQLESGSEDDEEYESDAEITVVENVPRARTPSMPRKLTTTSTDVKNESSMPATDVITMDALHDNSISTVDEPPPPPPPAAAVEPVTIASSNHTNGKVELPNGLEKSFDQIAAASETSTTTSTVPQSEHKNEIKSEVSVDPIDIDANFCTAVKQLCRESWQIWRLHLSVEAQQWQCIKSDARRCASYLALLMLWCGVGGLLFEYVEGNYELANKAGVKRVKRDFIDQLWLSSHNLRYVRAG